VAAFDATLKHDLANRLGLIEAIDILGPTPLAAPPNLLEALDDASPEIRTKSIRAVARFSRNVDRSIPVLLNAIETHTGMNFYDFFAAAKEMHPSAAAAPILLQYLKSNDPLVCEAAVIMLIRMERPPAAAAPILSALIKKAISGRVGSRTTGLASGSELPPTKDMSPTSVNQRRPAEPGFVSVDFTRALAKIASSDDAVPLLIEVLRSENPGARSAAALALTDLGPAASSALPALVETLRDAIATKGTSAYGYGRVTAQALGHIAPKAPESMAQSKKDAISVLQTALDAQSELIQNEAAKSLAKFGLGAASTVRARTVTRPGDP
jgi:HEAT repeats